MAPSKQSSFVEGSMNDRVSAVPPADFLGDGGKTSSTDYERQFAMDWKPPELQFERDGSGGGGGGFYSNAPGNRSSFMSVRSAMSAFTPRTGAAPSVAAKTTSRGLLAKVKDKLALHRSRSTWTVGGGDNEAVDDDSDDDGERERGRGKQGNNSNSFLAHFPVPPVFKHKRSESMDPATLRANQRGNTTEGHPTRDEFGMFQRDAAAAAGGGGEGGSRRPAPPLRADSTGAMFPGSFDPTKRPTRDEITANYQSLLASGFFGTHAIQSTRFSPPGATLHRRSETAPDAPSLVHEERSRQGDASGIPPSPMRQPPPVPSPQREAPPPPPVMDVDMEIEEHQSEQSEPSTPTGIPTSSTAVSNPLPPTRTSSRAADTTMSPPPLPQQRHQKTPTHKPTYSFSTIPYATTRPGVKPIYTQRPYRPAPVVLARLSVDNNSRPRSLDKQQLLRGTKRAFSSSSSSGSSLAAHNDSQTSFYINRSSYDYDPMATDGHGGIGVATTTTTTTTTAAAAAAALPEKVESGARKFVKRLKTSASRLSFRAQRSVSRFDGGEDDGDSGVELQQPLSRTSKSSTVRRSFSWRLGSGSQTESATAPGTTSHSHFHQHPHPTTNLSSFSFSIAAGRNGIFRGGGSETLLNKASANSCMDYLQPPPPPPCPVIHAPSSPKAYQRLPTIAGSPISPADRICLKKREIRTRRLRRKEGGAGAGSPLKRAATAPAMDWPQQPPSPAAPASPSKRPRRSNASRLMRALDYRNGTDDKTGDTGVEQDGGAALLSDGGMEGVEFSFHFPGRTRPAAAAAARTSGELGNHGMGGGGGGPLAVVPHVNRGLPSVSNALGGFRAPKAGSVRVVRAD